MHASLLHNLNHSQFIHISNMDFLGYGGISVLNVEEFVLQNAVFDGKDKTDMSLWLNESTANITYCSYTSNNIKDILPKYPIIMTDAYGRLVPYTLHSLVVVIDSNTSFSQCEFDSNKVLYTMSSYYDDDTRLSNTMLLVINSWVAIDSSTFVNNNMVAVIYGSYVYMYVIYQHKGHVDIRNSHFYDNSADSVIGSSYSSLNVTISSFSGNTGTHASSGGVFTLFYSNVFGHNNSFDNNYAGLGGVLHSETSSITFETCSFDYNYVYASGGVLHTYDSNITVKECNFTCNTAQTGAVIKVKGGFIVFETSLFDFNLAEAEGGVLHAESSHIIAKYSNFTHNAASRGAVIYATRTLLTMNSSVVIANNVATEYATVYLDECEVNIWGDYVIFSKTTLDHL